MNNSETENDKETLVILNRALMKVERDRSQKRQAMMLGLLIAAIVTGAVILGNSLSNVHEWAGLERQAIISRVK